MHIKLPYIYCQRKRHNGGNYKDNNCTNFISRTNVHTHIYICKYS